jgi:hypothetical protein
MKFFLVLCLLSNVINSSAFAEGPFTPDDVNLNIENKTLTYTQYGQQSRLDLTNCYSKIDDQNMAGKRIIDLIKKEYDEKKTYAQIYHKGMYVDDSLVRKINFFARFHNVNEKTIENFDDDAIYYLENMNYHSTGTAKKELYFKKKQYLNSIRETLELKLNLFTEQIKKYKNISTIGTLNFEELQKSCNLKDVIIYNENTGIVSLNSAQEIVSKCLVEKNKYSKVDSNYAALVIVRNILKNETIPKVSDYQVTMNSLYQNAIPDGNSFSNLERVRTIFLTYHRMLKEDISKVFRIKNLETGVYEGMETKEVNQTKQSQKTLKAKDR